MEQVIVAAIAKLHCDADGASHLVIEVDGTEIDDTEILMELAGGSTCSMLLMLLLGNEAWSEPIQGMQSKNWRILL